MLSLGIVSDYLRMQYVNKYLINVEKWLYMNVFYTFRILEVKLYDSNLILFMFCVIFAFDKCLKAVKLP